MSGALQATFMNQRSFAEPAPTVIGQAFGGGFWMGQYSTAANGIADYNLVIGPLSTGQFIGQWKNTLTATPGADSNVDGIQNTADMVADGNATVYPCAHFCNNLVIGGFSDWYMPALNELEIAYFNLKPTTNNNVTFDGSNPNAVPARPSNYSAGTPPQTSAFDFAVSPTGGAEAFAGAFYWTSTEASVNTAKIKYFISGDVNTSGGFKYDNRRVRAIRRVPV